MIGKITACWEGGSAARFLGVQIQRETQAQISL